MSSKKEEVKQFVNNAHWPVKADDGMLQAGIKNIGNFCYHLQGFRDLAVGLSDPLAGAIDKFLGTNFKYDGDGKGETDHSKARAAGRVLTEFCKQFIQEPGNLPAAKAIAEGVMESFRIFEGGGPRPNSPRFQKDKPDDGKTTLQQIAPGFVAGAVPPVGGGAGAGAGAVPPGGAGGGAPVIGGRRGPG